MSLHIINHLKHVKTMWPMKNIMWSLFLFKSCSACNVVAEKCCTSLAWLGNAWNVLNHPYSTHYTYCIICNNYLTIPWANHRPIGYAAMPFAEVPTPHVLTRLILCQPPGSRQRWCHWKMGEKLQKVHLHLADAGWCPDMPSGSFNPASPVVNTCQYMPHANTIRKIW